MHRHVDKAYLSLAEDILEFGEERNEERTGTGTLAIFSPQLMIKVDKHFPLLTTKKVAWKSVVHELIWFLRGDTNIKYLVDNKVNIWNRDAFRHFEETVGFNTIEYDNFVENIKNNESFAERFGDLGPIYGKQWRDFGGVDQIKEVIQGLKTDPHGRRHLVTAWNPGEKDEMALPPCHYSFQFYVDNDGGLSIKFIMRSTDVFLGLPFNLASYGALLYVVAHLTGYKPKYLIFSGGDTHIYKNHVEQVREQLTREPKEMPTLTISEELTDIDDLNPEHFLLEGYEPHGPIKGALSVG